MKCDLGIAISRTTATACARGWVAEKAVFFLAARDADKLRQIAEDLTARGATAVHTHALDFNHIDGHPEMLANCFAVLGEVDIALIAHDALPDQAACQQDVGLALKEFSSNGVSVIAVLTLLANQMETQRSGTIAVISSVAGDRGRPSNYLYGNAKAAVTTFCEGLRARLAKSGVHALTIKPGFVDTPMTKGLPLPALLVAKPERVASDIQYAIARKKDVIYTPWSWRGIMTVIKLIPSSIFNRMSM